MPEERRSAPRARISGARVVYESATGDHTETDALNLGRGGLFLRAAKPLPVGKRLALEIQVAGELVPWSALGRVVWVREHDDGERHPAGMGVKLIDAEDTVVATIERLVAGRVHTEPGGVDSPPQPAPVAPIVSVGHPRERTMQGVGASGSPGASRSSPAPDAPRERSSAREHEASVVLDLVARDTPTHPAKEQGRRSKETLRPGPYVEMQAASKRASPARARTGRGWLLVVLVVVAAAAAAYLLLGGDLDRQARTSEPASPPRAPADMIPSVSPTATATATEPPSDTTAAGSSSTPSAPVAADPTHSVAAAPSGVTSGQKGVIAAPVGPAPRGTVTKKTTGNEGNPY
jgi:uncharacterized protein (TIGR02266 family)